jgi:hypothetical protein
MTFFRNYAALLMAQESISKKIIQPHLDGPNSERDNHGGRP